MTGTNTTTNTGKTLGEIAQDILTTEVTQEDVRPNGELLAEHGLNVVHFRPAEEYHNGMTVAFKTVGRNAKVIEVATALVHPLDKFTRKIGTRTAVEAFLSGRTILLPIPTFLRKESPVNVLRFYLAQPMADYTRASYVVLNDKGRVISVRGITANEYHVSYTHRGRAQLWINPETGQPHLKPDSRYGWKEIHPKDIPEEFKPTPINLSTEEEAKLMTVVSKALSMCLLVSSSDFARLGPAKQTEVLASAGGKPVVFVTDFRTLRNKKSLVERLLKGEDVSMELEFNEVELTDDDKKTLAAVQPLIERIRGTTGGYEWLERTDDEDARFKTRISVTGATVNRDGYRTSLARAEEIWKLASAYWAGGEKPTMRRASYGGYNVTPVFSETDIVMGCQTISRKEVEYIAETAGWVPNLTEKEAK